jgi:hypothetical protein
MHGRSRDSIIFAECRTKAARALTVRKFPDELRAAVKQYAIDKAYTQEEALVTLLRDALGRHHYWPPFAAVDLTRQT